MESVTTNEERGRTSACRKLQERVDGVCVRMCRADCRMADVQQSLGFGQAGGHLTSVLLLLSL